MEVGGAMITEYLIGAVLSLAKLAYESYAYATHRLQDRQQLQQRLGALMITLQDWSTSTNIILELVLHRLVALQPKETTGTK